MRIRQLLTLAGFGLPILLAIGGFPCSAMAQAGHAHPAPSKTSTDTP